MPATTNLKVHIFNIYQPTSYLPYMKHMLSNLLHVVIRGFIPTVACPEVANRWVGLKKLWGAANILNE
jgi:hypothetical protein